MDVGGDDNNDDDDVDVDEQEPAVGRNSQVETEDF